jgi:hypothetical protein
MQLRCYPVALKAVELPARAAWRHGRQQRRERLQSLGNEDGADLDWCADALGAHLLGGARNRD